MEKKNTTSTIEQLFKSSEAIRIPAYQRAYSWESKECAQFLEDLLEQKGKKYYLGQFLFEDLDNTFFIIDGQQRLTTSILFFSAIAKILKSRNENTELLTNCYLTDVFETISDDQVIFRKITRKHQIPSWRY
jgi:uncharacterized protein with ParB-like and HNH nuclease domain